MNPWASLGEVVVYYVLLAAALVVGIVLVGMGMGLWP